MREMKDSGIEWIGKIPNDWKRPALKYVTDEITDFTASGSFADLAKNVKYLDFEDYAMLIRTVDLSAKRKISHIYVNKHAYNYLKKSNLHGGELILPNIGSVGAIYRYTPMYKKSTLAPNSIMIKSINNHYLYYLFNNSSGENALKRLSNATTQSKFNKTQLRNLKVILPTINEQNSIANFLDAKCADIDSLTGDIQKQIDILKEYKKSVITQAVTKGLDPNVEMKDSGIEWIGKIPRYWIYPKLTYILDTEHEYPIGDGDHGTIKANNYVQEGIPFIRVQNLGFATPLQLDDVVYITKRQNVTIKNSTLKPDDILFAKTGATIGKVGIVPKELFISNTTSHVGKITVNQKIIVPRFLFYALSSTVGYRLLWDIASQKSTRPELSIEEIKRLHIILPDSLQEQQAIVDYLDAKCADIDAAITGKQKQLDVLKEYKKSLIYEYVTGKKEVPCHE